MRIRFDAILVSVACLMQTTSVTAWGAAGHQIVATIAQINLLPSVREKLCHILPPNARCHLAQYASWADTIKGKPEYRYTAQLHYVNPVGDWPAETCVFGEHGWAKPANLLSAIVNVTASVMERTGYEQDIALRFLTHFIGDLHMPMHLSGRDRGGNDDKVRFEGRLTNLHSVWDTMLITKSIREMSNYTRPLPSKRIESALRGSIFDPYVRWIVWEGIQGWWREEFLTWAYCPEDGDLDVSLRQPHSLEEDEDTPATLPSSSPNQQPLAGSLLPRAARLVEPPSSLPVCPQSWATPMHDLNCKYVWPPHFDAHRRPIELDTPDYLGHIKGDFVVEKLLAMAGVRLAAVLNTIFSGEHGIEI